MGTKNVPVALLDQYLGQLNLEVVLGRAAIAQQLHTFHEKIWHRAEATNAHTTLSKPTPADRAVDSWTSKGCEGSWSRCHRTPRRHLFTPYKVSGGPDRDTRFMRYRVTSGHYVESGISFKITDDWLRAGNAHRALKQSWVGQTSFSEIPEYIEETALPMPGGLSSLGALRPRDVHRPPVLHLPQAVRVLPVQQHAADPLPAVPPFAVDVPREVRDSSGEQDRECIFSKPEVPEFKWISASFSARASSTLRDPPLLLCGGSYLSRRLGDRRVRSETFTPCLGLSSSRADPSRVSEPPLRGAHRYNDITDHPCGRRARYRARVRGGVLRSRGDMAGRPLDGVSRHRRWQWANRRLNTARPAWLKSHPCGESS